MTGCSYKTGRGPLLGIAIYEDLTNAYTSTITVSGNEFDSIDIQIEGGVIKYQPFIDTYYQSWSSIPGTSILVLQDNVYTSIIDGNMGNSAGNFGRVIHV